MPALRFKIPFSSDSQLSPGRLSANVWTAVRSAVSTCNFFVTGEVKLRLDWLIHDRLRYEANSGISISNILQPVVDAITGPSGVLIDVCQIQRFNWTWIDATTHDPSLHIELEYLRHDVILSRQLLFVHFDNDLCVPFAKSISNHALRRLVDEISEQLKYRDRIESHTCGFEATRNTMPATRFFHRAKLRGCEIIHYKELIDGNIGYSEALAKQHNVVAEGNSEGMASRD